MLDRGAGDRGDEGSGQRPRGPRQERAGEDRDQRGEPARGSGHRESAEGLQAGERTGLRGTDGRRERERGGGAQERRQVGGGEQAARHPGSEQDLERREEEPGGGGHPHRPSGEPPGPLGRDVAQLGDVPGGGHGEAGPCHLGEHRARGDHHHERPVIPGAERARHERRGDQRHSLGEARPEHRPARAGGDPAAQGSRGEQGLEPLPESRPRRPWGRPCPRSGDRVHEGSHRYEYW